MIEFLTLDEQSSRRAVELLHAGASERALRFFEHSFWLRHFPQDNPPWGCAYTTRPAKMVGAERGASAPNGCLVEAPLRSE